MELTELKAKRKILQSNLQQQYNECQNYVERFKYIYNVINTSQKHYLRWKENTAFADLNVTNLLEKFSKRNMTDNVFVNIIYEKLIAPINSGHVGLEPHGWLENLTSKHAERCGIISPEKNENIKVDFKEDTILLTIKSFRISIPA